MIAIDSLPRGLEFVRAVLNPPLKEAHHASSIGQRISNIIDNAWH